MRRLRTDNAPFQTGRHHRPAICRQIAARHDFRFVTRHRLRRSGIGIALRINGFALGIVFVGRAERMQQLVRNHDIVLVCLLRAGKSMHHADQPFLQAQRMFQRNAVLRRVIQHKQLDPAQLRQQLPGLLIHPPA